jgi:hypothetical protein
MEHLIYGCHTYWAKIWLLAGHSLTLAISRHTGDYIPKIYLLQLILFTTSLIPTFYFHQRRCHNKNLNSISARSETWYNFSSCSTHNTQKRRTSTSHSSLSADQQDLCPAWISGCPPVHWCTGHSTVNDASCTSCLIIFTSSSNLTSYTFTYYIAINDTPPTLLCWNWCQKNLVQYKPSNRGLSYHCKSVYLVKCFSWKHLFLNKVHQHCSIDDIYFNV